MIEATSTECNAEGERGFVSTNLHKFLILTSDIELLVCFVWSFYLLQIGGLGAIFYV